MGISGAGDGDWGSLVGMQQSGGVVLPPDLLERAERLSGKQRRVFEFLRTNPVAGAGVTIEQIGEQLDVSVSTVIRTAKELGYAGFGELKRDLRAAYLQTLDPLEQARDRARSSIDTDVVIGQLQSDRRNLDELISAVDADEVVALARAMAGARRTLVVSTGSYAAVGHVLAHQCRFLGYDVLLEARGSSYLAHEVANLNAHDLMIVIGFWRDRLSLIRIASRAREKGVPVVAITDASSSRLARAASKVYAIPSESTAFYQSMVAPLAFVYAVVNAIWQLDRERSERVAAEAQSLYRHADPALADDFPWPE
jgi:DNA-binding MurR/RpiR family transcriptional regulator